MSLKTKSFKITLIVLELLTGVLAGILFTKMAMANDSLWGQTYLQSITFYYGTISLLFFAAVILVGGYASKKLNLQINLKKGILFAIIFWIAGLILYVSLFNQLSYKLNIRWESVFILLLTICLGFNIGIGLKKQ